MGIQPETHLGMYRVELSDGSGNRNCVFHVLETPRAMEKWVFKRQVEQGYSLFFAHFWIYLMIFQSRARCRSTAKPISPLISGTRSVTS